MARQARCEVPREREAQIVPAKFEPFDRRPFERRLKPAPDRLDFGKLGHRSKDLRYLSVLAMSMLERRESCAIIVSRLNLADFLPASTPPNRLPAPRIAAAASRSPYWKFPAASISLRLAWLHNEPPLIRRLKRRPITKYRPCRTIPRS
jgi:hypothetical protein